MKAELSMNQIIHAAVRRDVARTEQALRALSDGDRRRAEQIAAGWAHLRSQLTHHHEQEDQLLWPYLRAQGVDADLLADMESEHQDLAAALQSGTDALRQVVADPSSAQADAAADMVAVSGQVIGGHLDHEERDIEPLIRQRSESPDWKEVEKKFRPGGVTKAGIMLAWLQDGASQRELTSLRQTIPAPVVLILGNVFGRSYSRDIAPIWRA